MAFKDYSTTPASNTTLGDGTFIGPNMLRNKVRPALQQLAADGKGLHAELTARIDALPTGGGTGAVSGVDKAATRTELAGIAATAGMVRHLNEAGREGIFVFNASNLSAMVSKDPRQAVYVPPASATNGASGAWVRRYSGRADARWFGAIGDNVTDNAVALQAFLDFGGPLFLPRGTSAYYSSARLIVRNFVDLRGEGYGQDVRVAGYADQPGTLIRFPVNVGGIIVYTHTTQSDEATYNANTALHTTQQGAIYSTFENFGLLGAKGATGSTNGATGVTGFETRTRITVRNVRVIQFGGKGFDFQGSTEPDNSSDYGLTSGSDITTCHALENGWHGMHIRGRDASVANLLNFDASGNGGWGVRNETGYGFNCTGLHTSVNALGAIWSDPTIGSTTWLNCYNEPFTGSNLYIGSLDSIVGGSLALIGQNDHTQPCPRDAGIRLGGSGKFWTGPDGGAYPRSGFGIGRTLANGSQALISYGATDDASGMDLNAGVRDGHMVYNATRKSYGFGFQSPQAWHGVRGEFMRWPSDRAPDLRVYGPDFDQGISFNNGALRMIPAVGGVVPEGVYLVGDMVLMDNVAAGGTAIQVVTTAGTKANTAWASGVIFYGFGAAPYAGVYRSNAGNVYKLTTLNPDYTGTVNAPTHTTATEVVGADKYGWTWVNATTVPVFKNIAVSA